MNEFEAKLKALHRKPPPLDFAKRVKAQKPTIFETMSAPSKLAAHIPAAMFSESAYHVFGFGLIELEKRIDYAF